MEIMSILLVAALFGVSVLIGRALGPLVVRLLESLAGKTKSSLDDRVITAIKTPLESFFFLIIFYFLIHSFPELSAAASFLERYTLAIIIILVAFLLSEASGAVIRWYYEEGSKTSKVKLDLSLLPLFRKITKIAIYIVGITFALSEAGFDVTGLLAVTSVVGIIIGLASQETLANLFAGLALQLDRPYHYGDYLRLPPPSNEIVRIRKIGMRSTKLEDMYHNTIIVSNSEFAKMRITNLSLPDDISIVPVQAELPLNTDLEKLKKRIIAALSSAKPSGLLPERGYSLSVESVKPSSVAISFSFWVRDYSNAPKIREIVNREILEFSKKKAS
ncbi:MAG: mechanosensitive ion channel family protein [Candidatus Micrarchaeota archaeon]|nr:mechanosensitive ion channel family protein [Candidatus Micrarchaeota archaeon]